MEEVTAYLITSVFILMIMTLVSERFISALGSIAASVRTLL